LGCLSSCNGRGSKTGPSKNPVASLLFRLHPCPGDLLDACSSFCGEVTLHWTGSRLDLLVVLKGFARILAVLSDLCGNPLRDVNKFWAAPCGLPGHVSGHLAPNSNSPRAALQNEMGLGHIRALLHPLRDCFI
jgi:hypothetical protein